MSTIKILIKFCFFNKKVKLIFGKKNTLGLLCSIWLIGLVASTPLWLMTEYTQYADSTECMLHIDLRNLICLSFLNGLFIFLPTIGLFILYICIVVHLKDDRVLNNIKKPVIILNSLPLNLNSFKQSSRRPSTDPDDKNAVSIIPLEKYNFLTISHQSSNEKNACHKHRNNSSHEGNFFTCENNYLLSCSSAKKPNDSIIRYRTLKLKNSNYTIIILFVTLFFYCFQLPLRIFLLWSYSKSYAFNFDISDRTGSDYTEDYIDNVNFISNTVKLIYFLHCISNPIIYNIISTKFRKAFFFQRKIKNN